MDSLIKDVRYGVRSLLKHPGFTAIAVVILALAIAATTSIFSVVNAVLLRPLPFPEPERLVVINEINPQQGPEPFELSYLNWLDLRQQSKSFEEIAGVGRPQSLRAGRIGHRRTRAGQDHEGRREIEGGGRRGHSAIAIRIQDGTEWEPRHDDS